MKLMDLNPRWATYANGLRGISFDCPHCLTQRLGVALTTGPAGEDAYGTKLWHYTGDTFENLTLTPSIDISSTGHWHGFITNGQIT